MTTKTEIRTEYAGFGLRPDGTWRKITVSQTKPVFAYERLNEYINDVNKHPDMFTNYAEYKVMNRAFITTFEEWHD